MSARSDRPRVSVQPRVLGPARSRVQHHGQRPFTSPLVRQPGSCPRSWTGSGLRGQGGHRRPGGSPEVIGGTKDNTLLPDHALTIMGCLICHTGRGRVITHNQNLITGEEHSRVTTATRGDVFMLGKCNAALR
ncbi:hypothetical protein EYF80_058666 [Liparis tanakae]|uniref:Uncharacterized protein n=1 Tax=Liparis tanakae TaxID=230148 RepID=A0A4Z2ERG6_9TELE|nr:hypothetical protein EYF80_058666 [Liparis tanakae]